MSKKRNRHRSLSIIANSPLENTSPIHNTTQKKRINLTATHTSSFHVPTRKQRTLSVDMTSFVLEKTFNKNISFFRNTFNQNDTTQLPFMSSLRIKNKSLYDYKKLTQSRPFTVQIKETLNQHNKKQIFDIQGKKSRISTAYYRWHRQSGQNTTQGTQFECSLRDYGDNFNPEELGFSNIIKPIDHKKCETKIYDSSQLICPKQRKCFNYI